MNHTRAAGVQTWPRPGTIGRVLVTPITPERLVAEVVGLVLSRPGRLRVVVDGPSPTRPDVLAHSVAADLRARGRAGLVVDAGDYLRPASVRLEHGREDPDELLDGWLDEGGLRREVLHPAGPGGSGRVLPRLWDATADRAFRVGYTQLPDEGVVLLHGALLLGRGLPVELGIHLRMSPAALARRLAESAQWTLPAHARYERERDPSSGVDVLVLSDRPDRPAIVRR
jgi:hypothetical protein